MSELTGQAFDSYYSQASKAHHETLLASNDAFITAMTKAIRKGREKVRQGTFVDATPPINALRIRGSIAISACGSPAAMCMESAIAVGGAQTMK